MFIDFMHYIAAFPRLLLLTLLWAMIHSSCSSPYVIPDRSAPDVRALHYAIARKCAVIVTKEKDIRPWLNNGFIKKKSPRDVQAGTASPISADGYILTADHVIHHYKDRIIHIVYGIGNQLSVVPARVVWRSSLNDIALLHVPISTPNFYLFSPPDVPIAEGSSLFHGGLVSGLKPLYGGLTDNISAQFLFTLPQRFRMDIPLLPGDSGGPILDNKGRLVGINSAVQFLVPMETPIFTESYGVRPNVRHLLKIIDQDRRR